MSTRKSNADRKAAASAAWNSAAKAAAADEGALVEHRLSSGISLWSLGKAATCAETVRDDAPPYLLTRMRWRMLANLTGTCPNCGACASVDTELRVRHEDGCPVSRDVHPRYLVNPQASVFLHGLVRASRELDQA